MIFFVHVLLLLAPSPPLQFVLSLTPSLCLSFGCDSRLAHRNLSISSLALSFAHVLNACEGENVCSLAVAVVVAVAVAVAVAVVVVCLCVLLLMLLSDVRVLLAWGLPNSVAS